MATASMLPTIKATVVNNRLKRVSVKISLLSARYNNFATDTCRIEEDVNTVEQARAKATRVRTPDPCKKHFAEIRQSHQRQHFGQTDQITGLAEKMHQPTKGR